MAEPIKTAFLDLCEKDQLQAYIDKSSDLADDWYGYQKYPSDYKPQKDTAGWIKYSLKLIPESFFLFGSGFADSEVDMTPVKGFKIFWDKKTGGLAKIHKTHAFRIANHIFFIAKHIVYGLYHWHLLFLAAKAKVRMPKDNLAAMSSSLTLLK